MLFSAVLLSSPLPCSSVVLHQVIETESLVLGFLQLFSMCASLRTNVSTSSTSFQHSNLLFLPSAALQSLLLALPFSLYHSRVCFSCIFCLVLLSPDLFEKVNTARLPAAESALMLFCQPGPASLSHPHLPPHSFWHVTLSGHSQQHWRLARTLTSHRFT